MPLDSHDTKLVSNVSDDFLADYLLEVEKSELAAPPEDAESHLSKVNELAIAAPNGDAWKSHLEVHFPSEFNSPLYAKQLTFQERFIKCCRREFKDLSLLQAKFICAIRRGDLDAVLAMMNDAATKNHLINFKHLTDCNPLAHAIDRDQFEIINTLSEQFPQLFTPAMFYKLAENGYDGLILNSFGIKSEDEVDEHEQEKTVKPLSNFEEYREYIIQAVLGAIAGKQKGLLFTLSETYKDKFASEFIQQAFLHAVQQVKNTSIAIVQYFLDQGAKINEGAGGVLPALYSCQSIYLLKYLLEQGADPNVQQEDYGTPLPYALTKKQFPDNCNSIEYIGLLVLHGANPYHKIKGSSPFELANKEQCKVINQAFLANKAKKLLDKCEKTGVAKSIFTDALPDIAYEMDDFNDKDRADFFQMLADINDKDGNSGFTKDSLSVLQKKVYKHLEKKQPHWSFKLFITVITGIFIIPLFFTLPWLFSKNKLHRRSKIEREFPSLDTDKIQTLKKLLNNDKVTLDKNKRPFFKADGSLRKVISTSSGNVLMTSKQAKKYDVLRAAAKKAAANEGDLSPKDAAYYRQRYTAAKA